MFAFSTKTFFFPSFLDMHTFFGSIKNTNNTGKAIYRANNMGRKSVLYGDVYNAKGTQEENNKFPN